MPSPCPSASFEHRTTPSPPVSGPSAAPAYDGIDVRVLLHRDDGRIALHRPAGGRALAPPGARLRPGESLRAAAARGLSEQAAVRTDLDDLEFCHLLHYRDAQRERLLVVFRTQQWRPAGGTAGAVWARPAQPPAACSPHTALLLHGFDEALLYRDHGWADAGRDA
ncbi:MULTISPECIES: NUDIX domain-containing protein [Streptomyces]|uniref:NUDIX domain-containing protein n=1 Tax=Streptomyces TaxID=1883 RepID=UPI000A41A2A8|nr:MULTISPECIES: NUDIX domain-containing protein [Streptomyces]